MKKYLFLTISVVLSGIIFWSCSEDGGGTTNPPDENTLICSITTPLDSSGFYAGDSISVIANADDTNGTILEVRFLMDGNGISSVQTFPYTTKIQTNLLAVGSHTITAVAENDKGKEVSSSITVGIIPVPPTNLTVTQLNVYTFSLVWTDNSEGEDGFKIERKIDDGEFIEIGQTPENVYIDSTMINKGYNTVFYQVKAFAEIYCSTYAENQATVAFPAPSDLFFLDYNSQSLQIFWKDNSEGEQGFSIDRKVGTDGIWESNYALIQPNSVSWIDYNLEDNTFYMYRIRAFYLSTYSEYS